MELSLEVAIFFLTFHQILNVIAILNYREMVYIDTLKYSSGLLEPTFTRFVCLLQIRGILMSTFTIEANSETVSIIFLKELSASFRIFYKAFFTCVTLAKHCICLVAYLVKVCSN
jgi:hypothetical protein